MLAQCQQPSCLQMGSAAAHCNLARSSWTRRTSYNYPGTSHCSKLVRHSISDPQHRAAQHHTLQAQPTSQHEIQIPFRISCSRRLVLSTGPTLLASLPALLSSNLSYRADAAEPAQSGAAATIVPALTVDQYLRYIIRQWPLALSECKRHIARSDMRGLSNSLLLSPFDDVRQATFYIPYKLMQTDIQAGMDTAIAYTAFLDKVKALDAVALAAARSDAEESQVEAALQGVAASLDDFVAEVKRVT